VKSSVRVRWMSLGLLGILLVTGLIGWAGIGQSAAAPAPAAAPTAALTVHPAAPTTHGDLIVGPSNSPYVLSPLTTGSTIYYQEGNITVLPGGRLYVENMTVSFLQFIGTVGNLGQRADHLYNFTIEGLTVFSGSTLTTSTSLLNTYVRLTVSVTGGGTFVANASSLEFPGWINVAGSGSHFFANGSQLSPNPNVTSLIENTTLLHDTSYSPGLTVTGGARVVIAHSVWTGYYRNNVSRNGEAGANLSSSPDALVPASGTYNASGLSLPQPTAPSLALTLGYSAWASARIGISYTNLVSPTTLAGVTLWYDNVPYSAGAVALPAVPANQSKYVAVDLPASFVAAVNTTGILHLLQASGTPGGSSTLNVTLSRPASPITVETVNLALLPVYGYNMVIAGGSNLTVADSLLDLTWNPLPGTPVDSGIGAPQPWDSSKILLSGGSQAYLASLSVPTPYVTPFDNQSVVIPLDNSSAAFIYRWGAVHSVSSSYGPIPEIRLVAYPAYNASQSDNGTVLALNDLAAADPDLASYVTSPLSGHALNYGQSDGVGNAYLLLLSAVVHAGSLPNGIFMGSYHLGTSLPGAGPGFSQWQYGAVTAYPLGMSPASVDLLPTANYPNYRADLSFGAPVLYVDNATEVSPAAAIGDYVTLSVPVENVGTAPLGTYTLGLSLPGTPPKLPQPVAENLTGTSLAPGETRDANFSWVLNESQVGLGGTKNLSLTAALDWWGTPSGPSTTPPLLGAWADNFTILVHPSPITISLTPPGGNLQVDNSYPAAGTLGFSGTGYATVNVTLVGPGGPFLVSTGGYRPGPISVNIAVVPGVQAGAQYNLVVTATYNHVTASKTYTNGVQIQANAAPPPNFLAQVVLGPLTMWMLLAIIAAAVVGLVLFLFTSTQLSRGKLVECGECGSLIPEAATACPKCGAEFETELVRCSRCGSTIPANSPICPECAAQLLGTPTPESKDPERQGYADFVERFRQEARKELADNYGEGAFWDWWKRQPTYTSFSQWKLQQSAATRAGMTAPLVTGPASPEDAGYDEEAEPSAPVAPAAPARAAPPGASMGRPSGPTSSARAPASPAARGAPPVGTTPAMASAPARRPAAPPAPAVTVPAPPPSAADAPGSPGLRACANCSKEIPTDFLVCPFCGSVTR
jgi:RNA polymerase subunit RPABC4/transcription elongation factor Spt4